MNPALPQCFDSLQIMMEGINLSLVQDEHLAKLLFLATKPEETFSPDCFNRETQDRSIIRTIEKFHKALNERNMAVIRRALHIRLHILKEHKVDNLLPVSIIESNFSNYEDLLSEEEEDILAFKEIFRMLSLPAPRFLKDKFDEIVEIKKIPVKTRRDDQEVHNNFIHTENKVLSEICDLLNAKDVCCMYSSLCKYKETHPDLKAVFNVPIDEASLTLIPGLKDVAFYFLISHMIDKQILNRLYTHCLECILQAVMSNYKEENRDRPSNDEDFSRFDKALQLLRRYPVASCPPGLCLIFHMDKDREGADNDFKRVKELFENNYGYDVFHKRDPTLKDIQNVAAKLAAQRNKFYDSLVIWFMGHGTHNSLILMDGSIHRRKDFIHPFSNIEWLNKKPKLFFIQACATRHEEARTSGDQRRSVALEAGLDSASLGLRASCNWLDMYGGYLDTSAVNNYADTLIAYATKWDEPAARGEGGSLYVQTVVDQLKDHGHQESIENVLRKVHYNTNTVLLQTVDCKEWKQTPYYECSLQKEFVFPRWGNYTEVTKGNAGNSCSSIK